MSSESAAGAVSVRMHDYLLSGVLTLLAYAVVGATGIALGSFGGGFGKAFLAMLGYGVQVGPAALLIPFGVVIAGGVATCAITAVLRKVGPATPARRQWAVATIATLLMASVAAFMWTYVPQQKAIAPNPSGERGTAMSDPWRFDVTTHAVGDDILGMKIATIGAIPGIPGTMSADNVSATFTGEVTLSGTYAYFHSDFDGSDAVTFLPSAGAEQHKLPALDEVNAHFIFRNLPDAVQAFGPAYGKGKATVRIKNFELQRAPAEVQNSAELVSVSVRVAE